MIVTFSLNVYEVQNNYIPKCKYLKKNYYNNITKN